MSLTFGILAALVTAVAIWVGYLNGQAKDEQARLLKDEIKVNEKLVKQRQGYIDRIDETQKAFLADLEAVKLKLDERDGKKVEANDLTNKLAGLKNEIASLEQEKADFQTDIPDLNEVDRLVKNLKEAKVELANLEGSVAELEADTGKLSAEIDQQVDAVSKNNQWIKNHTEFKSQEQLSATITAVYNDWGFVILSGGDAQGVTPRSTLIVKRGEEVIGELQVKTTTSKAATAEIMYSTLKEGESVQVGDSVSPKPVAVAAVEETTVGEGEKEAPAEQEEEEASEELFSF